MAKHRMFRATKICQPKKKYTNAGNEDGDIYTE